MRDQRKVLKALGLAAVVAMALTPFAAGSASATTLESNGVTQNKALSFLMSIAAGNTLAQGRTDGTLANTCTSSEVAGNSESPYTGSKVTGPITTLSWTNCSAGTPTVHQKGQLYFEYEFGTTNGWVFSEDSEWTVPTSLGFTINCKTGVGTRLGTLTGVASGWGVLHFNAVLNCGFLLPSASWKGTYTVTTAGLGISA